MTQEDDASKKVFISYCHMDGERNYRDSVLVLADWLNRNGLDCEIDRYHEGNPPPEGWLEWMLRQVESARFVLCVCTATYYRRFRKKEEPGKGKGATWEGAAITQELYDTAGYNDKFIPVGYSSRADNEHHIPEPLRTTDYYPILSESERVALLRRLTGQLATPKPSPGKVPDLPPEPRLTPDDFDPTPTPKAGSSMTEPLGVQKPNP